MYINSIACVHFIDSTDSTDSGNVIDSAKNRERWCVCDSIIRGEVDYFFKLLIYEETFFAYTKHTADCVWNKKTERRKNWVTLYK